MDSTLTNTRVVAVDGGTATGKSRLVGELAGLLRRKGVPVLHVSSGHLYRAVAWVALKATGQTELAAAVRQARQMSEAQLLELAGEHRVEMHGGLVWIDGEPAQVDEQLKAPGVGAMASYVA